ncbi:MAG TPA: [Fe-S]-binding protein [Blastocatellia bacterium]|nr:[Fe-S]-binding protein [Blastocatellia bacterium]
MSGQKLWQIIQRQGADDRACEPDAPPRPSMSRRTFIELIGFSAAGLALTGCRPPSQNIIPYVKQPVELTPGVASWYASVCGGCSDGCGVLVKVRDGRPIKLEGNPEHPLSKGGLCALAHGLVFSLYDGERLSQPLIGSKASSWSEVDNQITQKLEAIKQMGGKVRLLTRAITGPTSRTAVTGFLSQFEDGRHIVYEAVSSAAIRQAHLKTHKTAAIPRYYFDRAKLVVSFGADFLGSWFAPVQCVRDYARSRDLRGGRREMMRHIQLESRMSLTGSNADRRIKVSPAEEIDALLLLAKRIAAGTNRTAASDRFTSLDESGLSPHLREAIEEIARSLLSLGGLSLVVSGSNDADAQCLVNFINEAVGSYGKTIDLNSPSAQKQANDAEVVELVREMNAGEVAALIISGVNPAYDFFASDDFIRGLSKVPLKISLNRSLDETSALTDYVCPQHYFLEAWDDAEPVPGIFSLYQPVVAPLFDTRAYQESLLRWSGDNRAFYDVLRESWKERLYPRQNRHASFDEFWDRSLHDGFMELDGLAPQPFEFISEELNQSAERLKERARSLTGGLNLVLYEKTAIRDGRFANNPWLHELPDPITKITWDNYACVSPELARSLQLEEGRVVRISRGAASIELPVYIQPGQHDQTVAVAVGYGRTKAGKAGTGVGVNAYSFVAFENGSFQYSTADIALEKRASRVELASTQRHHTLDGRPIVKEFSLDEYTKGLTEEGKEHASHSIWKDHPYGEHKWGMVIDLNACIGCSACILSCQAENNVPVVGRDEVLRQREMHWIRVDRYYNGDPSDPTVVYQPVLCSQCDNASCESVCPVLATVHSSEGLNMQVYNRCVGTRYCANNCAYKVRRFNWFEYPHSDPIASLALNPDVTVRSRGVMEKCTFCVQRIEEVKIRARNEGRDIRDGEIQTACQQSCPANAITFGDLVYADSSVTRLKHDSRDYVLLEELNLRPAISYLAKVRNDEEA